MNQNITIFYSYAHEDRPLVDELKKHINILKWQGVISGWDDRDISAGEDWQTHINEHLRIADIILLIISPDFLASDYCYSIEMKNALNRHKAGEARIIPIIARSVHWEMTPLASLQVLPKDGKAVTKWNNRDLAFLDIAIGIRKAVTEVSQSKTSSGEVSPYTAVGTGNTHSSKELENTLEQLEDTLRNSYSLIRSCEEVVRYSDDPKEKAQARQSIEKQGKLTRNFLNEYMRLANQLDVSIPIDIKQISGYVGNL